MKLSEFLESVSSDHGPEALCGAIVFVALDRPLDQLIRYGLGFGPYHRGQPSEWSHCFLLAEAYAGPRTKIFDCTIRDPRDQGVLWHADPSVLGEAGGIYRGTVADYDDPRVTARGVKMIPLATAERDALITHADRLAGEGYRYDLPGLLRQLVRLLTGIELPAGDRLLFCSAFVQAVYRRALGQAGDFAPELREVDVTPDDIWYSSLGRSISENLAVEGASEARTPALDRLYRALGYAGPLRASGLESAAESPGEPMPLDLQGLDELQRQLDENPGKTLERAHELWDSRLTERELWEGIERARAMLADPEAAIARLEAASPESAISFDFPGKSNEIPIDPSIRKYETIGDAAGWVIFSGPYLIKSWFASKAPFRWHHSVKAKSSFIYDLPAATPQRPLKIALFSDFGTGLYHSRYIAKQLEEAAFPYAIHLGDVYYAGRSSEFEVNFEEPLAKLIARTKLFTLNSNHEMYSSGGPYFDYLDRRRAQYPQVQEQEGSYFCLRNDTVQVVGIDTAYFGSGRHRQLTLQDWLSETLSQGRSRGLINILLSADHPYEYGSQGLTALLEDDLRSSVLDKKLVDLWFWGNTHYCALFDSADRRPFVGSCIGHGGYPYERIAAGRPVPAPVRFLETWSRFPGTNIRPDRGNNGFCWLSLDGTKNVSLHYVDWTGHQRCLARIAPDPTKRRFTVVSAEEGQLRPQGARIELSSPERSPAISKTFQPLVRKIAADYGLDAERHDVEELSRATLTHLYGAERAAETLRDNSRDRYIVSAPPAMRSSSSNVRANLEALSRSHPEATIRADQKYRAVVMNLSEAEKDAIVTAYTDLGVEKDIRHRPLRSPLIDGIEAIAVPANAGRRVAIRVTGAGVGPLSDAEVIVLPDPNQKRGYKQRTNAGGVAEVPARNLGPARARVMIVPRAGFWSRVLNNVDLRNDLQVELAPIELPGRGGGFGWGQTWSGLEIPNQPRGLGVRVAVIDSGVDAAEGIGRAARGGHPNLVVSGGENFVDGENSRIWWDDADGHGTHCAGVIAANARHPGFWGFAPDVELFALRIFGRDNTGGYASDIGDAIRWAIEHGCHIINMSFGVEERSRHVQRCAEEARDAGILCVAAAGNDGGEVLYPARLEQVIGVAAVGHVDEYPADSTHAAAMEGSRISRDWYIASFSNRGSGIDVCGPGVAICSTVPPTFSKGSFSAWDGTSMASPHVAGIAALLLSSNPEILALEGRDRYEALCTALRESCENLGLAREHQGWGLPRWRDPRVGRAPGPRRPAPARIDAP